MTNTVIIEDHPLMAESIAGKVREILPGYCMIVHSIDELAAGARDMSKVDLWIIDLELGKTSAWDFIEHLRAEHPDSDILLYTMHDSPWIGSRIRRSGVRLAVSKSDPVGNLDSALRAFRKDRSFYSPSFADQSLLTPAFTSRELDVLRLITEGLSTAQAADRLGVTENTVLTYRKSLMAKFGVHKIADLMTLSRGLI